MKCCMCTSKIFNSVFSYETQTDQNIKTKKSYFKYDAENETALLV